MRGMSTDHELPAGAAKGDYAAKMTVMAGQFAQNATRGGWGPFDFTNRSLGELDSFLERTVCRHLGSDENVAFAVAYERAVSRHEGLRETIAFAVANIDEVLVRQYGGRRGLEDQYRLVLPPPTAEAGAEPANPAAILDRRLKDRVGVRDQVHEAVRLWVPAITPPDADDLPALMHSAAEAFVRVAKAFGADWLDYSPDSVMRLDDFIDEAWGHYPRKGACESLIPSMGAYIGEALIRQTGAHWVRQPDGTFGVELRGVAFPMSKVAKRFDRGLEHSIGHFYREITSHWLSGNDQFPATWKAVPAEKSKRGGFFGLRRR
jgi:hypothetical protein